MKINEVKESAKDSAGRIVLAWMACRQGVLCTEGKTYGGKPAPETGFSTHIAGQKPSYIDAGGSIKA